MSKSKAMEALEQWGGHLILLGIGLATIHPALSIGVYLIREFTEWKLPWPMKGQWPPGDPFYSLDDAGDKEIIVTQMSNVEDIRTDSIFTLIGTIVGGVLHEVALGWMLRSWIGG